MKRLSLGLLLLLPLCAAAAPTLTGPVDKNGAVLVQIDFPVEQRTKNVGGRDSKGLCVFTSIGHAARWQNETRLVDFQAKMRQEDGGGWPEKVDRMIAKYGPGTDYLQYQGSDPAILIAALQGGRMPSVTYSGHDLNYGLGVSVAHMVNLVAYTGDDDAKDHVIVLDNNFVQADRLVKLKPSEFKQRWRGSGSGSGWAVILLSPPPPPIPVNRLAVAGVAQEASPPFSPPSYRWRWYSDWYPGCAWLETPDGKVAGVWRYGRRDFRWRDRAAGRWRAAQDVSPYPVPARPTPGAYGPLTLGRVTDYGVSYLPPAGERITRRGEPVRLADALECLRRPKKPTPRPGPAPKKPLPDDGSLLRLTVSGNPEFVAAVRHDLEVAPELAPWKGRLVVQYYPDATHWHLKGVGLPAGVVLQLPPDKDGRGKVLHRQADYSGPGDLAAALRRADPNYDPSRDPDRRRPASPDVTITSVDWQVAGTFGVLLSLLGVLGVAAIRRKEGEPTIHLF